MGVREVIKNSVLNLGSYSGALSLQAIITMGISLFVSFLFGFSIYFIYNKFYKGVVYNQTFGVTLVLMTVLTTAVTLAISTNIVISLGMVGALSIVRYRTAVKEPLDLVYLFWAITTGISVGAGMYPLALLELILVVVIILMFEKRNSGGHVYITVVHYKGNEAYDEIRRLLANIKYRVKSRTLRGEVSEFTFEVFHKNENLSFVEKIRSIENVEDVTLIQYDGEYHV